MRPSKPKNHREERNEVRKGLRMWEAALGGKFPDLDTAPLPDPVKRVPKPDAPPNEHQIQCAVVKWWGHACKGYGLPFFALFAVPNAAQRSPQLAAWLKAEGLRSGVPDLLLDVPASGKNGLRLETKTLVGRLSSEQEEYRDYYLAHGYAWVLYRSADDGIAAIQNYLKDYKCPL